jgi:hypothetical protein
MALKSTPTCLNRFIGNGFSQIYNILTAKYPGNDFFFQYPICGIQYIYSIMITEEKIKAVKKMLGKGEPEGEIKESLLREGYSKEDIDKAFVPHRYDMRPWYLFFGIVFLLTGVWLLLRKGTWGTLVFPALLFVQYYRETERLKNNQQG